MPSKRASRESEAIGFEQLEPCRTDPILGWTVSQSVLGTALTVGAIILAAVAPALPAAVEGNLRNPALDPDLLGDLGYWNSFLVSWPILFLTYVLYFRTLPKAILTLCVSNVLEVSLSDYNSFVRDANRIFSHWLVRVVPWVVGFSILGTGTAFYALGDRNTWHSPDSHPYGTVAGWMGIPLTFFLMYIAGALVARICATFVALRRLFQLKTNIQPLHPDGCGGLLPLGRVSMKLNVAVFVMGFVCAAGVIVNMTEWRVPLFHWTNLLLIVGYVIGSSLIFFLPLLAAHQSMKKAKMQLLYSIHERIESLSKQIIQDISSATELPTAAIEEIENVRKVYDMAREMPVYPFNFRIVSSFIGSLGLPLVLVLIERLFGELVLAPPGVP